MAITRRERTCKILVEDFLLEKRGRTCTVVTMRDVSAPLYVYGRNSRNSQVYLCTFYSRRWMKKRSIETTTKMPVKTAAFESGKGTEKRPNKTLFRIYCTKPLPLHTPRWRVFEVHLWCRSILQKHSPPKNTHFATAQKCGTHCFNNFFVVCIEVFKWATNPDKMHGDKGDSAGKVYK